MKTTFVRPVARLLLLVVSTAGLMSCMNQPTPGSRRAAQDVVDPWRLHKHRHQPSVKI
ncbi:hypothetical protein [Roseimicrobium gellanilyticum]|uniref:hypothetical protein n=1 Tax=Roseimicrobium gellanilyticum TaxID=748857 RepID=UPI001474A8B6|nr:hypothetical protein [Roseimicrobium gellanilyticum]